MEVLGSFSGYHPVPKAWIPNARRFSLYNNLTYLSLPPYQRSKKLIRRLSRSASKEKCPKKMKMRNIEQRSSCPWTYGINHDPLRIPMDIAEAKCLCRNKCLNTRSKKMGCDKIYYTFSVLMRNTTAIPTTLYPEQIKIAVGCTCAKRKSRHKAQ